MFQEDSEAGEREHHLGVLATRAWAGFTDCRQHAVNTIMALCGVRVGFLRCARERTRARACVRLPAGAKAATAISSVMRKPEDWSGSGAGVGAGVSPAQPSAYSSAWQHTRGVCYFKTLQKGVSSSYFIKHDTQTQTHTLRVSSESYLNQRVIGARSLNTQPSTCVY